MQCERNFIVVKPFCCLLENNNRKNPYKMFGYITPDRILKLAAQNWQL